MNISYTEFLEFRIVRLFSNSHYIQPTPDVAKKTFEKIYSSRQGPYPSCCPGAKKSVCGFPVSFAAEHLAIVGELKAVSNYAATAIARLRGDSVKLMGRYSLPS